ncbi:serine-threonine protein kinase [Streptomyces sp. NPDC001941]|uniref:serine-threonine protein kinase n=1 Tax=Streptomyces sp. NPDC001941 TaxID=3154659 RepID=UPI0033334CE5
MNDMSVAPYREVTFDKDGDVDAAERDGLARLDVTDLVMFAHGWNSSRTVATRLYSRFFEPFPALVGGAPGVRMGYAGIVWPSMMFTDEPIPDFGSVLPADGRTGPALDAETRRALDEAFPGQRERLDRLAGLLELQPDSRPAFDEFAASVRELVGVAADSPPDGRTADLVDGEPARAHPAFLYDDAVRVCERFTLALAEAGLDGPGQEPGEGFGISLKKLWNGAKELLRQATYYEMKRRAGTVGQRGLGPLIGTLARSRPDTRIHLVGHSQGARLVAFALPGLPAGVRNLKSVTLLQGAFSHYAFAPSLPHAARTSGALRDLQKRVDGPVVACYSRFDSALGVIYPLASALADDSTGLAAELERRWGAVGHDGVQACAGTAQLTLERALREGLPASGCVNVDAQAVVRDGGPPSGAHSDICHPELARVVVAAGRIGAR